MHALCTSVSAATCATAAQPFAPYSILRWLVWRDRRTHNIACTYFMPAPTATSAQTVALNLVGLNVFSGAALSAHM
jgi:hypothetical protein